MMDSGSQASPPFSLKKRGRNQCHLQILFVKLKKKSGMGKNRSVFQAKNDACLDFLRWASQEQPDICPVSTHNVEVSEVSTVAMSQCSSLRSLNCGNITMFKSQKSQLFRSQIGSLALNRRKWPEVGPEWSPGSESRPP